MRNLADIRLDTPEWEGLECVTDIILAGLKVSAEIYGIPDIYKQYRKQQWMSLLGDIAKVTLKISRFTN